MPALRVRRRVLKKLMDMEIYELTRCDDAVCGQMEVLMRALSARCTFSAEKLRAVIDDNNSVLLVASEGGRIVGCATLCPDFITFLRQHIAENENQ